MSVKSTYNFIPALEEAAIYKPSWAHQVSHDIPFSDGECGEIHLSIEAETPIFIRNGHGPDEKMEEFSQVERDGKPHYFIPATSLKGMIRNVMEILSKSRMRAVNDHRYSFRDLSKDSLYKKNYSSADVRCGWLSQKENGKWFIEDCGKPEYITHEEIDDRSMAAWGKQTCFKATFDGARQHNLDKEFKSSLHKYSVLRGDTGVFYNKITFNGVTGTLIFTGQPGLRNHQNGKGKNGEFIFPDRVLEEIEVPSEKQKDFKFIYLDHDEKNISAEWKYWRQSLNQGGKIPVFFTKDNESIKHFGLAFMYKLPFQYAVKELAPAKGYDYQEMDLTETIFGTVDYPSGALKGRVFFSHAFAQMETAIRSHKQYREILASPKASYYPFYLQQSDQEKYYKTYMDEDAVLSGFKRYPRREVYKRGSYTPKQEKNEKVFSKFWPLEAGAAFTGKIRFHNLRPAEIGALLSALTFHGSSHSVHSLGAAKPYGAGVVKLDAQLVEATMKKSQEEYLAEFEDLMGGEAWLQSTALTELAATTQVSDDSLAYPATPKTFVEYKNEVPKLHLRPYSEIVRGKPFKHFPSIRKKVDSLTKGLVLEVKTLGDLKSKMAQMDYGPVPEPLHADLKKYIIEVCKDRPSKNKLIKKPYDQSYEWYTTIQGWLGETEARAFKEALPDLLPKKKTKN